MVDLFANKQHIRPRLGTESIHMSLRMSLVSPVDLSGKGSASWARKINHHCHEVSHVLHKQSTMHCICKHCKSITSKQ